jgi:hypothetical protein
MGGSLGRGSDMVVLRDPEGNEFCFGDGDPEEVKRLLGG